MSKKTAANNEKSAPMEYQVTRVPSLRQQQQAAAQEEKPLPATVEPVEPVTRAGE